VKKVEIILRQHDAHGATFYEIGQHAPVAGVRKGIETFKERHCDIIVAVGGGSPIDASKAMLYNLQKEFGGPTLPQIAIPTTLSAAEYTASYIPGTDVQRSLILTFSRLVQASPMMKAKKLLSSRRSWLQQESFLMRS